jgi:hypothetical protein
MKIEIPKVIVLVDFGGYAAELAGQFLQVWVNPPQDVLSAYTRLVTELQESELAEAQKTLMPESAEAEPEAAGLSRTFAQLKRWLKIKKEDSTPGVNPRLLEWYAVMWSQGAAESHWTLAELQLLEAKDPALLGWMISQTWKTRLEHIERKKKV